MSGTRCVDTMRFDAELYGAFVRIARRKMGLTPSQLAERAGVDEGILFGIETGQLDPLVDQFMGINEAVFGDAFSTRAIALAHGDMGVANG